MPNNPVMNEGGGFRILRPGYSVLGRAAGHLPLHKAPYAAPSASGAAFFSAAGFRFGSVFGSTVTGK